MNRRISHIGLVYGKELKETLRDRRTLAVMVLFPIVVYPLLSLLLGQAVMQRESRYDDKPLRVSATPNSQAAAALRPEVVTKALKLSWIEAARPSDVAARKLDVFVEQAPASGPPPHSVSIIYDSSREDSGRAQARVMAHLAAQLVPGSARQFQVADKDVGTPLSRGGYLLSKVVPLLVVVMVILGAFYPAMETTAGERDRGTLETTLVAPVIRIDLLAGKVLSVATLALLSGVLNLGSLSLTFVQLASSAETSLPVPWGRLAAASLVLPPAAIMFAAVLVMVATAAKSFKEAQSLLTPVYFAFLAPAMAVTLGEFPNSIGWALIPGVNLTLITRDFILGETQWLLIAVFLLSTVAVTIAALAVASHLFDSERLLAVATRERKRRGQNRAANSSRGLDETDAAVGFALALVLFFLLAPLSRHSVLLGTLASQWLGMLGFVVIYLSVRKLPIAASLRLLAPSRAHMMAALLLGASAWIVVGMLTQWLVPPSSKTIEDLRGMLKTYPAPVAVLLFAITPAVCEEVLFRGLILRGMLGRFPPALSILLVSVLFGVFHFSLDRLLPTATLGVLLGLAAWRSGSLWPSMLLHALNNSILVGLTWAGKDEAFDNLQGTTEIASLALAVVALTTGLWLLLRRASSRRDALVVSV